MGMYFFGVENALENKKTDFFLTNPVISQVNSDVYTVISLGRQNLSVYENVIDANKTVIVDKLADKFLDDKAAMIKSELEYAVRNFDDSYYEHNDTVSVTEEGEFTTSVYVPSDYPESIKMAVQVLANAKGRDFLKYDALVRTEAFAAAVPYTEAIDFPDGSRLDFHVDVNYGYDETNVKNYITMCFEEQAEEFLRGFRVDSYNADQLSERENLKYYVENYDGEIYSNINSIPANIRDYNYYIYNAGDKVAVKGLEPYKFHEFLKDNPCKKLCLYFENDIKYNDIYKGLYDAYNRNLSVDFNKMIIIFGISFLLSLMLLVLWLRICGRKADKDLSTARIDKIPNDIHLILSVGLIALLSYGVYNFVYLNWHDMFFFEKRLEKFLYFLLFVYVFICMAVFTEWLSSVVRVAGSKSGYFKNTVIARVWNWVKKLFFKLKAVFGYKPKRVKVQVILLSVGFILLNVVIHIICISLLFEGDYPEIGVVLYILVTLFNVFVIYKMVKFFKQLDLIVDGSFKTEDIDFKGEKVPGILNTLAHNMSDSNSKLNVAIEDAVKKEHLKTQLITNVSHDLKTPLTSLISYSELLSECDIKNEDAEKYIDVINQQSKKLKILIEDLIEASKVSTGNVTLNKTPINLSELAVQAIVEYTSDFEKNELELIFTEPENPLTVFADGTKTYRIISNLLNNAKKYSAPHTRVYASISESDGFGLIEIKNISKEPLNISPDELTERFVRGDESRTKEGNGLGLAIAKDLCVIQGGSMNIAIDGDLFKVTVKLPLNK
ncbi:MAG: hypothetical protein J6D06_05095 [Clostridia bacterium]|nr:hypothetical protein [Clostridia bacterium]